MASIRNNLMIVMELTKAGADVNLAMCDGATALHMAARHGHECCAAMLIQAGADIHRRTNMGTTSIWLAIDNKHEKIAKLLRQLGARDDREFFNKNALTTNGLGSSWAAARCARP